MPELPSGTVTFLFSDIEGSTRLLEQLGRDRYGVLLAEHNRLARAAFAEAGGIEIDRQGDSFFVAFRSAGAAVGAAVAAQRALSAADWPGGVSVRVRIGLHTGEVSVGSDGYVGYAVHQAGRIGDIGHGGQIVVSATTAQLVEHDLPDGVRLRDLGDNRLPASERPERLYQLDVDGLPGIFPPLTTRSTGAPAATRTQLLEREAELATIRAVVDAARTGVGRLVAVESRAGMGKTRLLTETRAAAAESGLTVLSARGGELEHEFAFGVVRQLFEPLLAAAPAEERAELLGGAAGLAATLFEAGGVTASLDAGTDISFGLLHGLYWLAANVALRQPTLLLVDDLHWADGPSARWLSYLVRRLEGLPLLVVVGLRPPETSREPELLNEIVADPGAVVLRPDALSLDSAATLARSVFAAEPDPAFVSACHAATGGNPLFLQSLLDTLRAEGVPPTAAYAAQVVEIGPESVSRAVALRLSRLPAEANLLARAVAVLGDGAALHHAAALADLDRELASHAATTLARTDILRLEMPLEFVHPVVRAAVYEDLAPSERMAAHRRAAEILQATGAEPEQVACHLVITTPARDPFVVRTLREAARLAVRRGSPDTAITYLQRALDEPAEGPDRTAILVQLGMVERRVDTAAAAEHFAAAIDDIDDPVRRVEIAVELGRCLFRLSRNEEALRVFTQAIEWLGEERGDLRQLLEAELIGAAWFDEELNHVAEQRIVAVREDELEGEVGRAVMLATLRYYDARRGVGRERVRSLDDPALVQALISSGGAPALYYASFTLTVADLVDESARFLRVAVDMAKERGDLVLLGGMLIFRGFLMAQRGDLSNAEEDLRAALELGAFHRRQQVLAYYVPWMTDVLVERGELDRAETELARLGLGEQVPANAHLFFFLSSRARLRLARREPERALADLELLGCYMDSFHVRNPAFVPWRSQLAETLVALDRSSEAVALAREEVELARTWGAPRAIGMALRARGLAEGGKAGLASLREAVEVLEDSAARLELARALVDLGAALRRSNQRAESRDYLRRGLELAHRLGARPLEDHAQAELAATGARPRRLALSGVDALTPSERRVAEMAAENMTNKDIAQALFVTPKTVEVHLSSVYRKLQIASRSQLPDALVVRAA